MVATAMATSDPPLITTTETHARRSRPSSRITTAKIECLPCPTITAL